MSAVTLHEDFNATDDLDVSSGDFCYAACRNRLLVAISLAETNGFDATRDSLVELLGALEEAHNAGEFPN